VQVEEGAGLAFGITLMLGVIAIGISTFSDHPAGLMAIVAAASAGQLRSIH
jgi:hypothetical protein